MGADLFVTKCSMHCLENVVPMGGELWIMANARSLESLQDKMPPGATLHRCYLNVRVAYPTAHNKDDIDDTKAYVTIVRVANHLTTEANTNTCTVIAVDPSELVLPFAAPGITVWRSLMV